MGIKKMQGTSAHLEYIGPKGRKRRSSCVYNKKGICDCKKSSTYMSKCVGRMYCQYFDDTVEGREHYKNELEQIHSYSSNNKISSNRKISNNNKNIHKIQCCKKVTLLSLETGKLLNIEIVSDEDSNPFIQRYSESSQMGKQIKRNCVGDVFSLIVSNKTKHYKIIDIKQE